MLLCIVGRMVLWTAGTILSYMLLDSSLKTNETPDSSSKPGKCVIPFQSNIGPLETTKNEWWNWKAYPITSESRHRFISGNNNFSFDYDKPQDMWFRRPHIALKYFIASYFNPQSKN